MNWNPVDNVLKFIKREKSNKAHFLNKIRALAYICKLKIHTYEKSTHVANYSAFKTSREV